MWAGLHYQQGTFSLQTMPWCCSVAECWEVPLHHDTQWNTILPLRCSSSIWAWHTNQSPNLQHHPRPPSSRTVMRISTCHQLCYADYWKDLQSHTWSLIWLIWCLMWWMLDTVQGRATLWLCPKSSLIDLLVSPSPRTQMRQRQSSISCTGSGTRTSLGFSTLERHWKIRSLHWFDGVYAKKK